MGGAEGAGGGRHLALAAVGDALVDEGAPVLVAQAADPPDHLRPKVTARGSDAWHGGGGGGGGGIAGRCVRACVPVRV